MYEREAMHRRAHGKSVTVGHKRQKSQTGTGKWQEPRNGKEMCRSSGTNNEGVREQSKDTRLDWIRMDWIGLTWDRMGNIDLGREAFTFSFLLLLHGVFRGLLSFMQ